MWLFKMELSKAYFKKIYGILKNVLINSPLIKNEIVRIRYFQ